MSTWSKVRICLGCGVDLGPDCLTEYERCPICGIEPAGWATIAWVLGEKPEPVGELTLGLSA
jgi:hypothetical protein